MSFLEQVAGGGAGGLLSGPAGDLQASRPPESAPTAQMEQQMALAKMVKYLQQYGRPEQGMHFTVQQLREAAALPRHLVKYDHEMTEALQRHSKVDAEVLNDDLFFQYKPAIRNIQNKDEIIRELGRRIREEDIAGTPVNDVLDCYLGASKDLKKMILSGEIIAVDNLQHGQSATISLFSRGPIFGTAIVPLTAKQKKRKAAFDKEMSSEHKKTKKAGAGTHSEHVGNTTTDFQQIATSFDFTTVVRRGEAIGLVKKPIESEANVSSYSVFPSPLQTPSSWFDTVRRVSTEKRQMADRDEDDDLSALRGFNRKYSVTVPDADSLGLGKTGKWLRDFNDRLMPLDERPPGEFTKLYSLPSQQYSSSSSSSSGTSMPDEVIHVKPDASLIRYGVSAQLRDLWKKHGQEQLRLKSEEELRQAMGMGYEPMKIQRKKLQKKKQAKKRSTWTKVASSTNTYLQK